MFVSNKKINEDNHKYWKFTSPYRVEKAMNTLTGIVQGIAADNTITSQEISLLRQWVAENEEFRNKNPLKELIDRIEEALSDNFLDSEEIEDILWLCEKFNHFNGKISHVTADMQKLHGIFAGIIADGVVSKSELEQLSNWIDEHEHLKGTWPYDETESLILQVLKDGIIDNEEHKLLLNFFSEFLRVDQHKTLKYPLNEVDKPIQGLCAVCPDVTIARKTFCVTGKLKNKTRKEVASIITTNNGCFSKNLNKDVDYLLIGSDGNEAWAFSCYGRKVEQAINLRKEGHEIILIHEFDFWGAVYADAENLS